MSTDQEQQQSYTGYTDQSQEPHYEYPPHEQHHAYSAASQQPYGQPPVQVFVQFTQAQRPPHSFDGSRIAAALSYACGWLSGIAFFLFSDGNRYVRFHALQSLLFFGGINAFDILFVWSMAHFRLFPLLPFREYMEGLAVLFFLLLNFVAFVGWFVALFQAARGNYFKLPVVGEIVSRLLQAGPPDMVK